MLNVTNINKKRFMFILKKIIKFPFCKIEKLHRVFVFRKVSKLIEKRKERISNFSKKIPHTEKVYEKNEFHLLIDDYDYFITGSDQVWNLTWYFSPFFLDFVPSNKKKLSYAASVGLTNLTNEQLSLFKNSLINYSAVSVREQSSVNLLKDISPVPVVWTLDPTLLLCKEEWDKVSADKLVQGDYVFCYFLGNSKKQRNLAKEYAKRKKLKLVNIPYIHNIYSKTDTYFADIKLFDIGPKEFISLIKHAKFIFTDSFHAMLFSGIYQKQYIVFHREGRKEMGTRINTLSALYKAEERFCDSYEKENIDYISSLTDIDYSRDLNELEMMKEQSMNFLLKSLSE